MVVQEYWGGKYVDEEVGEYQGEGYCLEYEGQVVQYVLIVCQQGVCGEWLVFVGWQCFWKIEQYYGEQCYFYCVEQGEVCMLVCMYLQLVVQNWVDGGGQGEQYDYQCIEMLCGDVGIQVVYYCLVDYDVGFGGQFL